MLDLVGSDYAVYAFPPAQLALWAEQAEQWQTQQRIAEQARDDAEQAIEASFALAAAEQGAVELGRRLLLDAIERVQIARQKTAGRA